MEIAIVQTAEEAASIVADSMERLLTAEPAPVLGLATGSSPVPVYRELIRRHRKAGLGFGHATMFLLDEYVGLPPDHPEAYRTFIRRNFTDHIDVDPNRVNGPDGGAEDLRAACVDYETAIRTAGGIDLQLLGIGGDGHIGFNEPGSSLGSRTRLKTLTGTTRADNARFFDGDEHAVPRHVLTQGVGTILDARHLVLVATGRAKAEPIAKAVEGPITAMVPASALQLHPHATVVLDEEAAGLLTNASYYRDAYENKPEWQHI